MEGQMAGFYLQMFSYYEIKTSEDKHRMMVVVVLTLMGTNSSATRNWFA